jgi:ddrB-like ParB superfamily domain/Zeta toxin
MPAPNPAFGMFDHLIPRDQNPAVGMFDHLIPKGPEKGGYLTEFGKAGVRGIAQGIGMSLEGAAGERERGRADYIEYAQRQIDIANRLDRGEEVSAKEDTEGMRDSQQKRDMLRKTFEDRLASAPEPVDPRTTGLAKAGQAVSDWGANTFRIAEDFKNSWTAAIGEAGGTTVPFIGASLVAPEVTGSLAITSGLGFLMSIGGQIEDAEASGASKEQIMEAMRVAGAPGLTESIPLEVMFAKVPEKFLGRYSRAVVKVLGTALAEGGQEAFQTAAQNLIAKFNYDPDRPIEENVAESAAVGAIIGAGMSAPVAGYQAVREGAEPAPGGRPEDRRPPVGALPEEALPAEETILPPEEPVSTPTEGRVAPAGTPFQAPPEPAPTPATIAEEAEEEILAPVETSEQIARAAAVPDSPRLTPEDRKSPIPNEIIDSGKAAVEAATGRESTFLTTTTINGETTVVEGKVADIVAENKATTNALIERITATVDPAVAAALGTAAAPPAGAAVEGGGVGPAAAPAAVEAPVAPPREYPLAPYDEWYGDRTYEAAGGKMVSMSPDEFLAQSRPMEMDETTRENVDDLKRHIEEGGTLDPLKLTSDGREDGRHRAIAAKELGIAQVPVIQYRKPEAAAAAAPTEIPEPTSEQIAAVEDFSNAGAPRSEDTKDFGEWVQKVKAHAQAREAHAEKLVADAGGKGIRMQRRDKPERKALVGPDMTEADRGKFRVTYIDEHGPSGHMVYNSFEEAASNALQEGYAPTPTTGPAKQEALKTDLAMQRAATVATPVQRPRVNARPVRDDVAITSDGERMPVTYAVVEADDLVASMTDEGVLNPAYPQELQPRDRSRKASISQIEDIASNTDPLRLDNITLASDGAPIVAPDGVVESGNGRTLGLRKAYNENRPNVEAYRQYLANQGYPVEGMNKPVLVRIRGTEMTDAERQAFARKANKRNQLEMSAPETAMADAAAMSDDTVALFRGGDIDTAANRDFIRSFMGKVVSAEELGTMTADDGGLSQDAIKRVQGALLGKAYSDNALVKKLIESTDNNIKSIGGALQDVSGLWARKRGAAAAGEINPEMDITENLLEAVRLVERARDEGRPLAEYANQKDIFSGTTLNPITEAVLGLMYRNTASWTRPAGREKIAAALQDFITSAMSSAPGADMLGTPPLAPAQALAGAKERQYEPEPAPQEDLLQSGAGRGTGKGDGKPSAAGAVQAGPGPQAAARAGTKAKAAAQKSKLAKKAAKVRAAKEAAKKPRFMGTFNRLRPTKPEIVAQETGKETLKRPEGLTDQEWDALLVELTSPEIVEAIARMNAVPPTDKQPGYGTARWWANRIYNFGTPEKPVNVRGVEEAVPLLVERARNLAVKEINEGRAKQGLKPIEAYTPARDRKMIIIIGAPAAGKSSIANPLAVREQAAIADVDDAKTVIPEYYQPDPKTGEMKGGIGANAVHEESSALGQEVLERLLVNGDNIVIPKVGHKLDSIEKLRAQAVRWGYTVELHQMDVSAKTALTRMIKRFKRTGRLINPAYFLEVVLRPGNTYTQAKKDGKFDGYAKITSADNVSTRVSEATGGAESVARGQIFNRDGTIGPGGPTEGRRDDQLGQDQQSKKPRVKVTAAELRPVKGGKVGLVLTETFAPKAERWLKDLRKILDDLGLTDVNLKVWERVFAEMKNGVFNVDGQYMQGLIDVAIKSGDPLSTLYHEAIHAMRDLGLFSKTEWAILSRMAKLHWMRQHKIKQRYAEFSPDVQIEEAIVAAFTHWKSGGKTDGIIAKSFRKMEAFIKAVAKTLFNLDVTTTEDIFQRVMSGEVGARPRGGQPRFAKATTETVDMFDGPREQFVLPGAEKISDAQLAQRKAEEKLRPTKGQKDVGGLPLFGDEKDQMALFSKAWHGTPHEVTGRFTTDKIGTGEGGQSFGWGLYFAAKKAIGEFYRDQLSKEVTYQGKKYDGLPMDGDRPTAIHGVIRRIQDGKTPAEAVALEADSWRWSADRSKIHLEAPDPDLRAAVKEQIAGYNRIAVEAEKLDPSDFKKAGGRLYQVNLPEDPDMVNWEEPLDRQSAKVRKALEKFTNKKTDPELAAFVDRLIGPEKNLGNIEEKLYPPDEFEGMRGTPNGPELREARRILKRLTGRDEMGGEPELIRALAAPHIGRETGRSVYRRLSVELGSDRAASEALRAAGIPGHRFYDNTSRDLDSKGNPSFNYVIYDDAAIEIEARFALSAAPHTTIQSQAVMQGFIQRGQPIDRAIRVPFSLLGGLDKAGQWTASKRLADRYKITPQKAAQRREGAAIGGIIGAGVGTIVGGLPGTYVGAFAGGTVGAYILGSDAWPTNGAFKFFRSFAENAKRGLITNYGLDPQYIETFRQSDLYKNAKLREGAEHLKVLHTAGVGPKEAEVLHKILNGQPVQDADMTRLAAPIRKAIDDMGAEAVSLGLISAESFERNRGAYLHRVYLKNEADQASISKWVSKKMSARRKKIIGDELKGRGIFLEQPADRIMRDVDSFKAGTRGTPVLGEKFHIIDETTATPNLTAGGQPTEKVMRRVYWPANEAIPAKYQGPNWVDRGTWEVRKEGKTTTLWRDYSKAERTKMGEIIDARYTIAKTFMLLANDLATGKFYQDIAVKAEWTQTQPPPDGTWKDGGEYNVMNGRYWEDPDIRWVKVPDTNIDKTGGRKKWGGLAGKFVRAEIWRDLNELNFAQNPGTWRKIYRQWKGNHTFRHPVVHMNNVMSNLMFMDMADVRGQDLVAGIKAYLKGTKDYQEALDNGAFGGDVVSQELRDQVLLPILDEITKQTTGAANPFMTKAGMLGVVADKLWTFAKDLDNGAMRAYQAEDAIFRMALYIRRRGQGETPEVAARAARETFLNYDIRAPWVVALRNTALPFIGYTYRAVPQIMHSIQLRPWKLAKYIAVAWSVNALSYMLDDWGDDDEDKDGEEKERAALRDEEQGNTWLGTPRMVRMPWRDSHGLPVFLDTRRWIPAGDVFDSTQGSAALPIPAPLQFGGPIQLAYEFMLNKQAFSGDEITNDLTDTNADKAWKVADWAWKAWTPPAFWNPGSHYWTKIHNAITGAKDTAGNVYSLPQAALSSIGIKVKAVDVEDGIMWHYYDFKQVQDALRKDMRRNAYDLERGLISQSAHDRNNATIMLKYENLGTNLQEFEKRIEKK